MAYHHFAHIYDQLMKEAPYNAWLAYTEEVLRMNGISPPAVLLDLGCGTGEIALRLSRIGYQVIGVDLSEDMLSVAENKAAADNLAIQWIKQDARSLQGFTDIDVCVSYCDVINYVTSEDDLAAVFSNVYKSLRKEGLFIFDVHDFDYAKNLLMGHTFAESEEELAYIWECEPGIEEGQMYHNLTFFLKSGDHYIKFEEEHVQKVFPIETYEKLLKNAGFSKIEFSSDFNFENSISPKNKERNFIIAKK